MARVLVALSLVAVFAASPSVAQQSRELDLSMKTLFGEKVSIEQLRGQVVVVNFWATWCQPCIAEFPVLANLATRYGRRGLVVVAASIDEDHDKLELHRFEKRMPDFMKLWVGTTIEDLQRLGLGQSIPVTVLVDREGKVLRIQRGSIVENMLDADIEKLLAAPRANPGVQEASGAVPDPATQESYSVWQNPSQPSPATVLLSSHSSSQPITASPHRQMFTRRSRRIAAGPVIPSALFTVPLEVAGALNTATARGTMASGTQLSSSSGQSRFELHAEALPAQ